MNHAAADRSGRWGSRVRGPVSAVAAASVLLLVPAVLCGAEPPLEGGAPALPAWLPAIPFRAGAEPANYAAFSQQVVQRFRSNPASVTERDLLLLMSQPQEFKHLQAALPPELAERALLVRRSVFERALQAIQQAGSEDVQAVIALGSWARELNSGDLDAIVKGGRPAAARFNRALQAAISTVLGREADDVFRAARGAGASLTVEALEIYVSTLEDFGYDTLRQGYQQALELWQAGNTEQARTTLRRAAREALQKNLEAQRWVTVQTEYYPGASGQDFVRQYFGTEGKSRTFLFENGRLRAGWHNGQPMSADDLGLHLAREVGLSLDDASRVFRFPVIADEWLQWTRRAPLGPREQAKGLERAMQAAPADFVASSATHRRVIDAAREINAIRRTAEQLDELVQAVLTKYGLSAADFSRYGGEVLEQLTEAANIEALSQVSARLVQCARESDAAVLNRIYREAIQELADNELLAGYAKLPPEKLRALAMDIAQRPPARLPAAMAGLQNECRDLLLLMAEGIALDGLESVALAQRLVNLAREQGRLTAAQSDEALRRLGRVQRWETGLLDPLAEQQLAVLRQDLCDAASFRALLPEDSLAEALRLQELSGRTAGRSLRVTEQLDALVREVGATPPVDLLRSGFQNSEVAFLDQLDQARRQGLDPRVLGQALQRGAPRYWRSVLAGLVETLTRESVVYTSFGSVPALIQLYLASEDATGSAEKDQQFVVDVVYGTFPLVALGLDGMVVAWGGEVDSAQWQRDAAAAALEALGFVHPGAGLLALSGYVMWNVGSEAISNEADRELVMALRYSLAREDPDTLTVQDGARSFRLAMPLPLRDPETQAVVIQHSPAFLDLCTPRGDTPLAPLVASVRMERSVRQAIRDYAARNVWPGDATLDQWARAVRLYFPDLDLDQVETWNMAAVSEQRGDMARASYQTGVRLVRRYLNQRNLLLEATLRHLRGRVDAMRSWDDQAHKQARAELGQLEKQLQMEQKIVPHADRELASFLGWLATAAASSQTRVEQIHAIWQRYLQTYREGLVCYERIRKHYADAGLEPPDPPSLFGLVGVAEEDQKKFDELDVKFHTLYGGAGEEFRRAKGSAADPKDAFDADAFRRLLSLRLRQQQPGTLPPRRQALEEEALALVEEIRDRYRQRPPAAPPEMTAAPGAPREAPHGKETVELANVRLAIAGPQRVAQGLAAHLSAQVEGLDLNRCRCRVAWYDAATEQPIGTGMSCRLAADGQPLRRVTARLEPELAAEPSTAWPTAGHTVAFSADSPIEIKIHGAGIVAVNGNVSLSASFTPPPNSSGRLRIVWSHDLGTEHGATFSARAAGREDLRIELWLRGEQGETKVGEAEHRLIIVDDRLQLPDQLRVGTPFVASVPPHPELVGRAPRYGWQGAAAYDPATKRWGSREDTSQGTVSMVLPVGGFGRDGAERVETDVVQISARVKDADDTFLYSATGEVPAQCVALAGAAGAAWDGGAAGDRFGLRRRELARSPRALPDGQSTSTAGVRGYLELRFERPPQEILDLPTLLRYARDQAAPRNREVVPIEIAPFRGYLARDRQVIYRGGAANPLSGYRDCGAIRAAEGWLTNGPEWLRVSFHASGHGHWDRGDDAWLLATTAAVYQETAGIVAGLRFEPGGRFRIDDATSPPEDPPREPLHVHVTCPEQAVDPGAQVAITADVSGGRPPYRFQWDGGAAGSEVQIAVSAARPGTHRARVVVTDAAGQSAAAEAAYRVRGAAGFITGLPARVRYGGSYTLAAELPPALAQHRILWHASPQVAFAAPESPPSGTTVVIDRCSGEPLAIWGQIVDAQGATVGELEQVLVEVVPPTFALDITPPEPRVGQTVAVRIRTATDVAPELLDFRWLEPAPSQRQHRTEQASEIELTPRTVQPLALHAVARVPGDGDELGELQSQLVATSYTIRTRIVRHGPPPQIWVPGEGLRDVAPGQRATGERIFVSAEIADGPEGETVRWNWTANEGTLLSNPSSAAPTVSRSEPGPVLLHVTAANREGLELGSGELTFQVVEPARAAGGAASEAETWKIAVAAHVAQGDFAAAAKVIQQLAAVDAEAGEQARQAAAAAASEQAQQCEQQWEFARAAELYALLDRLNPGDRGGREGLQRCLRRVWQGRQHSSLGDQLDAALSQRELDRAAALFEELTALEEELPPCPDGRSGALRARYQQLADEYAQAIAAFDARLAAESSEPPPPLVDELVARLEQPGLRQADRARWGSRLLALQASLPGRPPSESSPSRGTTPPTPPTSPLAPTTPAPAPAAVEQGYFGVTVHNPADAAARSLGVTAASGAVVTKVWPQSPAERCGLEAGDLIVGCGGVVIQNTADLHAAMQAGQPGDRFPLDVHRDRRVLRLELALGAWPSQFTPPPAATVPPAGPETAPAGNVNRSPFGRHTHPPLIGIWTVSAGTREARERGVETPLGAVITQVQANSPAARAGLRVGDVVVAVDQREIANYEDLEIAALSCPIGARLNVTVVRGVSRRTLQLAVGQGPADRQTYLDYRHPSGGYTLRLPVSWKITRSSARAETDVNAHDRIVSRDGNYELACYLITKPADDVDQVLSDFQQTCRRDLGSEAQIGRVHGLPVPLAFAAVAYQAQRRVMLYRIAVVKGRQFYVIDALAPVLSDPAALPDVLRALLETM